MENNDIDIDAVENALLEDVADSRVQGGLKPYDPSQVFYCRLRRDVYSCAYSPLTEPTSIEERMTREKEGRLFFEAKLPENTELYGVLLQYRGKGQFVILIPKPEIALPLAICLYSELEILPMPKSRASAQDADILI